MHRISDGRERDSRLLALAPRILHFLRLPVRHWLDRVRFAYWPPRRRSTNT